MNRLRLRLLRLSPRSNARAAVMVVLLLALVPAAAPLPGGDSSSSSDAGTTCDTTKVSVRCNGLTLLDVPTIVNKNVTTL